MGQYNIRTTQDHSDMTTSAKLILFCYLIFTPTIFSKALPEPQFFGSEGLEERTIEIPDNVLEVAAVGFVAGLAGNLLFGQTTTTTTTTTTAATTTAATTAASAATRRY